ncbi:MAG: PepSY-associated TM helix domain-containing protein [Chitinophagaceae bacterium]
MKFRKLINTLHLWFGLISGIVLLVVALTGCVLAFEDEIRDGTQHELLYVQPENKPLLNVQQTIAAIKLYDSKIKINQLRYFGQPGKAIQCFAKDKKIYAVDPYTGKVLGVRDQEKDPLYVLIAFHRTLLLGKLGEDIIYWNVRIFLVMLISGIVLWLPRRVKQIRQSLTIKKGASGKRRNYDLHSVLGFYACIPLLIIAMTGIDMSADNPKEAKQKSVMMATVKSSAPKGIYDSVLQQVYHNEAIEGLRVTLPKDSTDIITVNIRYQTSGLRKQTVFSFDRYSGKLLKTDDYRNKTFSQRFFGSNYEVHTGRVLGLPGKIIMFLAALIAASLPITGFLIWRGKNRKKSSSKKQPVVAKAGLAETIS